MHVVCLRMRDIVRKDDFVKITLSQMRVYSKDPKRNISKMTEIIHASDAEIVIFPQLCISGMYLGDDLLSDDYIDSLMAYHDQILNISPDQGIVFGNVSKQGNAAYFAYQGEFLHIQEKNNLNDYEKRYFNEDNNSSNFQFKGKTLKLIFDEADAEEIDLNIFLGSKPYDKNENNNLNEEILNDNQKSIAYVNHVGIQNTGTSVYVYDGGSYLNYNNKRFELNHNFETQIETIDLEEFQTKEQTKNKNQKLNAIVYALKSFDEEVLSYGPNWLVGVSGGLDSSLTLALMVMALGKDRVVGVNMPSKYSSSTTINNAKHMSELLGFKYLEIPVQDLVESTVSLFNKVNYDTIEGLAYENIQARLRGHILMTLSSLENGVVMNNGNKVEVAFGYATMYGDSIGAISLLADLNKLEVGKMALEVNEILKEEIIPENLIPVVKENSIEWDFAPSAELAQDQKDPMKWGYHDELLDFIMEGNRFEDVMELYLTKDIYNTKMGKYLNAYGLDDPKLFISDLEWVQRVLNLAVYKRVQAPPILSLSKHAFGSQRQESQLSLHKTKKYEMLKAEITK